MFAKDLHMVAWWLWGWENSGTCPIDHANCFAEPEIVDAYVGAFEA